MKPYWMLVIMGLGSLVACAPGHPTLNPGESPIVAPPSPTPASPSPRPTLSGNPLEKGQDKAASARTLAESAKTPDDWKLVIAQWQQAITWLQAVPKGSPDRKTVDQLLPEYRQALTVAQAQAKRSNQLSSNAPPVAVSQGKGEPLLVIGGNSAASPTPSSSPGQEAVAHLKALQQQQIETFTKTNAFAATIGEFASVQAKGNPASPPADKAKSAESGLALDTANYAYQMTVTQPTQVVITAIAKRAGFASYSSLVVVNRSANQPPQFSQQICATAQPSQTPPMAPQLDGDSLKCPAESKAV